MKKHHLSLNIFYLLLMTLSFSGCQKSPINGDLDGQWQVMSVEPEAPETIITNRIYYCFYMHTCQLTICDEDVWAGGNMNYNGNNLSIDFPDLTTELAAKKLRQFGIYSNPVTFSIGHLDKKKLILKDGDVTITLRKF